jgi:hypothetical protein
MVQAPTGRKEPAQGPRQPISRVPPRRESVAIPSPRWGCMDYSVDRNPGRWPGLSSSRTFGAAPGAQTRRESHAGDGTAPVRGAAPCSPDRCPSDSTMAMASDKFIVVPLLETLGQGKPRDEGENTAANKCAMTIQSYKASCS